MNEPGDIEVERELVRAMNDSAGNEPVPAYDPQQLAASGRRHRRQVWALAASVAAVAALGAGLAALLSGGGPSHTVPVTAGPAAPRPVGSPPASAPDAARGWATMRTVLLAAERYENPATRGTVQLGQVAALFTDQAAFTRVWGSGGLGATCGAVADGALTMDHSGVLLYRGSVQLPDHAAFTFDDRTGRISGVSCGSGQLPGGLGHQTIAAVFGSQVSGGKAGDGLVGPQVSSLDCSPADRPLTNWYGDIATGGGLAVPPTWQWQVTLNGDQADGPLSAVVDHTGLMTQATCPTSSP
ncbi:hypothetical protein [Streptacidiphilus sp. EB129]|uniref:hypothetical protein n=1 Tax=Streptacidiphilus sp. EB129 TaxID=3156262 RepID=UPI0035117118